MKKEVRRGKYKSQYRWEVWKNNKLESWTLQKGSGLRTLSEAKERFTDKSTLVKDTKKYTNIKTKEILQQTNFNGGKFPEKTIKMPKAQKIQYQVSGYVNNVLIVGRSQVLGMLYAQDKDQAREEAWNNFFMRVGDIVKNHYSADEGMKNINKVKNLKEGWVVYSAIKKN